MTILTVIQDACVSGIALERPTAVYGSSVREHLELGAVANEMADMIVASHDWQKLQRLATITGDGSTTAFDLPSDYARMALETQLWSSVIEGPLLAVRDKDVWLQAVTRNYEFLTNAWTIYGDQIHFRPALDSGETVTYWYQSDLTVQPSSGSNKTAFDADTDTFRLDERLLKLGIIWKWREMKGLPYAEDMATYERLLSKLMTADRGPAVLTSGSSNLSEMGRLAYPWSLS